jgi:hypothetical protein
LVVCFAPLWDLNTRLNFAFFKEPAETAILKLGDDLLEPVLGYEKIRDVKPYQIDINRELSVPKNCLWVVNDKTCRGIYFFRRGFLDSEAGYLYVLEMSPELEKGDTKSTVSLGGLGSFFISIDLGDGWYYVYTD